MLTFTSADISQWVASFLLPFCRIAAVLMVAPVIGARIVPIRIRAALAVIITVVVVPHLPAAPPVDPLSPAVIGAVGMEVAIGVAIGFALRIAMVAMEFAGQMISQSMGLGFGALIDPENGTQVPALSQFYMIMTVLIFLALNAHLVLIELMVDSFRGTPPGVPVPVETFGPLIAFGGEIFAAGVLTSLPAVAALLFVNLAFGVMTRTSPQFNVFAVGFPVMIVTGLVIVLLTLPVLGGQVESLLSDAFAVARATVRAD